MLDIINNLTLFFEDNYAKINVRRYSRIMKISPPTASKLLKKYEEENLLESSKYERYIFFNAKRDNKDFIDPSRTSRNASYASESFEFAVILSVFNKK